MTRKTAINGMRIVELDNRRDGTHFLDSGAYSLYTRNRSNPAFYDSQAFYDYMDAYAEFVKEWSGSIDHYANVDVLYDPERTWQSQQYLEKEHGLRPIPVVHAGTDVKWFKKYMDAGYDYIGIGGAANRSNIARTQLWTDRAFNIICDQSSRLPLCRVHGFAFTGFELLRRYPWYSVDSTTWLKRAAYGIIIVPQIRYGKFVFDEPPHDVFIGDNSPYTKRKSHRLQMRHYKSMPDEAQGVIRQWLKEIGVRYGKRRNGQVVRAGISNSCEKRMAANVHYFERLRASKREMTVFYAGTQLSTDPRSAIGRHVPIMSTFYAMRWQKKPSLMLDMRKQRSKLNEPANV